MNVKIGTVATQFLFWDYLFQNFGIGSLQCSGGGRSHRGTIRLVWPAVSVAGRNL
jgi:hypothetical protein